MNWLDKSLMKSYVKFDNWEWPEEYCNKPTGFDELSHAEKAKLISAEMKNIEESIGLKKTNRAVCQYEYDMSYWQWFWAWYIKKDRD